MKQPNKADKVRKFITRYPNAKAAAIALSTGVTISYVYYVLSKERHKADEQSVNKKITVAKLKAKKAKLQKKVDKLEATYIPLENPPTHKVTGFSGHTYEVPNFAPQKPSLVQSVGKFFRGLF